MSRFSYLLHYYAPHKISLKSVTKVMIIFSLVILFWFGSASNLLTIELDSEFMLSVMVV